MRKRILTVTFIRQVTRMELVRARPRAGAIAAAFPIPSAFAAAEEEKKRQQGFSSTLRGEKPFQLASVGFP